MTRFILYFTAACAAATSVLLAVGSSTALQVRGRGEAPNYDLVFSRDRVSRLDLYIRNDDWLAVVRDLESRERDDVDWPKRKQLHVPADITIDGLLFRYASFRLSDNSDLADGRMVHGSDRLAFHLTFDATSEKRDSTLGGFTDLAFSDGVPDSSYVRTSVVMDLLREAGLPAPATAFMRVFLNHGEGPVYLGVYTILEVPSPAFLNRHFGSDLGNLHKPKGTAADWAESVSESFTEGAGENSTGVADAIAALNAPRADAARWRSDLEAQFDVYSFLRWLALNTIIGTTDAIGLASDNHYLYSSPLHSDRLFWIPWHQTVTLEGEVSGAREMRTDDHTIDLFHDRVARGAPLIRLLMDDPAFRAMYREQLRDLLSTVFESSRARDIISSKHKLIAPYVTGEDRENWRLGLSGASPEFDAAVYGPHGLLSYIERRIDAARRTLNHSRPKSERDTPLGSTTRRRLQTPDKVHSPSGPIVLCAVDASTIRSLPLTYGTKP